MSRAEFVPPPLPKPQQVCWIGHTLFTDAQMHAYAEAAAKAERERWRAPVLAMNDAVLDTMASGRPIAHLDSACDALMQMLGRDAPGAKS